MSTRATYHFEGPGVTYYIHYDGYPEGAAAYFYTMLTLPENQQRGGNAEAFIRANELAEFTGGHEEHGDTEYRYTVKRGNGPGAVVVATGRHVDEDRWRFLFVGTLARFIEIHQSGVDGYLPFREVRIGYCDRWLNEVTASDLLARKVRLLATWLANGVSCPGSANWAHVAQETRAILDAFPNLGRMVRDQFPDVLKEFQAA